MLWLIYKLTIIFSFTSCDATALFFGATIISNKFIGIKTLNNYPINLSEFIGEPPKNSDNFPMQ
jgi:hypothetical protein